MHALFQRTASSRGSVGTDLEHEITQAMFSEADWLLEQLERLRQDACADAWRVWRLRELADYCRRSPDPTQQVKAFADFLAPRFSTEVHHAAAECIRLLLPAAPVSISDTKRAGAVESKDKSQPPAPVMLEDARQSDRRVEETSENLPRVAGQDERLREEKCLVLIDGLDDPLSVEEALAVTQDWGLTNRRRVELIELEVNGQLSDGHREELQRLQKLAWAKRNISVPLRKLAAIRDALERERRGEHET